MLGRPSVLQWGGITIANTDSNRVLDVPNMNVLEHNSSYPLAFVKGNQAGQAEIGEKSVIYIYQLIH